MEALTLRQRIWLVEHFLINGKVAVTTYRAAVKEFGPEMRHKLNPQLVKRIYDRFHKYGTVEDSRTRPQANKGKGPITSSRIKIAMVKQEISESPRNSLRRISQKTNISKSSVYRILRGACVDAFPYKIQVMHAIPPGTTQRRVDMANELLCRIDDGVMDTRFVWFSDEAHFHLDGYVNRQNYRFWATENPLEFTQKPLHPQRTTVWAAMSHQGIVGPVFIHQTINSDVYANILEHDVLPFFIASDTLDKTWFMQDGARPHTTRSNMELLFSIFGDRLLSNKVSQLFQMGVEWAPYSPDLNPCDYFLWGYVKDRVYTNSPRTIQDLEEAISKVFDEITADTLGNVLANFQKRLQFVMGTDGGHFQNILK